MGRGIVEISAHARKLSLPPFAERRLRWLGSVTVGGRTKRYISHGMPKLTVEEQHQLESRIADLEIDLTPPADHDMEVKAALLAEMFLTFPSQAQSEMGVKTKTKIYLEALGVCPAWSLRNALRKWYAGKIEGVAESAFSWAPSPALLLRACEDELRPSWQMLEDMKLLLDAKPLDDTIKELEQTQAVTLRPMT